MTMYLKQRTVAPMFTRTDNMMRFFREVRRYKIFTPAEEKQYFTLYQKGSEEEKKLAHNKIMEANIGWVITIARSLATNNNELMDFINEGIIGLHSAISGYNLKYGTKFSTYAISFVKREINYYRIKYKDIIRNTNAHKIHYLKTKIFNEFIQKYNRQPNNDELMEYMNDEYPNLNLRNDSDVMDTKVTYIDDGPIDEDEHSAAIKGINEYNTSTASFNEYENVMEKEYAQKKISMLLHKISPKDQEMIKMIYGIGYKQPYTISEIAFNTGYSKERIRQKKEEIIEKMKASMVAV